MKTTWKAAALGAALLAAASAGAAFFPPAHAQTAVARTPRALEIFGGRGSQIGVTVRDVDETDAKNNKLSGPAGVVTHKVFHSRSGETQKPRQIINLRVEHERRLKISQNAPSTAHGRC